MTTVTPAGLAGQSVVDVEDDLVGQVICACQKDLMGAAGCAFLPYSA